MVSVDICDPFRRNSMLAWVAIAGKRKSKSFHCVLSTYKTGSWDPGHKDHVKFSDYDEAASSLYLNQCLYLKTYFRVFDFFPNTGVILILQTLCLGIFTLSIVY